MRRLEKLWAMIQGYVDRYGTYTHAPGDARLQDSAQSGVLRINCIDCLDRTNVVQCWLARKQLDGLLAKLGLLPASGSIKESFPEVQLCVTASVLNLAGPCRMQCCCPCCTIEVHCWSLLHEHQCGCNKR